MYSKPLPRIITGAVVAMIAVAAFLTFTRGEAPAADTASATLPGLSGKNAPVVGSSTPTPTSPASADTAEREAESAGSEDTKTPTGSPAQGGGGPTTTPTTSAPDPEPTKEPPPPSPTPTPNRCGLFVLLGCK
ncbi:hypothetical protein [Aeromicrobium sp.]|uniref:hypothetical protein n=1 Tax=Aeromicrobium sp. TaxID=1871063 RepID=UPI002FC78B16